MYGCLFLFLINIDDVKHILFSQGINEYISFRSDKLVKSVLPRQESQLLVVITNEKRHQ